MGLSSGPVSRLEFDLCLFFLSAAREKNTSHQTYSGNEPFGLLVVVTGEKGVGLEICPGKTRKGMISVNVWECFPCRDPGLGGKMDLLVYRQGHY